MSYSMSEQLVRRSVVPMACTIAPELTIAQRRCQSALAASQHRDALAGKRDDALLSSPVGRAHVRAGGSVGVGASERKQLGGAQSGLQGVAGEVPDRHEGTWGVA